MSKRIGKSLVVNGVTLVTEAAWNAELEAKHQKLVEWLRSQHLAGVLNRRNENVAWLTGGAVQENRQKPGGKRRHTRDRSRMERGVRSKASKAGGVAAVAAPCRRPQSPQRKRGVADGRRGARESAKAWW